MAHAWASPSDIIVTSALFAKKILLLSIDATNKTLKIGDFFQPSGDNEKDINFVMKYYSQYKGINPDQS